MSRTLEYWRNAWDKAKPEIAQDENAGKTLNLLAQYAGFYKSIPVLGISAAWGGNYGRFFSGRWYTEHGSQVQNAIANFYHESGYCAHNTNCHSVEYILACVKTEIGGSVINPDGNLAKILQVIKEKTQVDYDYVNMDAEGEGILRPYDYSTKEFTNA